ncbi:MAG: aldose 1-epimerase family protein [Oscillospiraceae bacterium]|nr:aldose 1-epimerase family protein [Oscillospiraceae bacterium]
MFVTIHNQALTVRIEDAGAQLASIRDRRGVEYLWQGDPAIWNRRAPLLFPFIARLKDEQYLLRGKPYHMPTHGFCRSAPFTVETQSETGVTFRYADTEQTRESYPFSFVLRVTYTLEGSTLVKTHRVENRSDEPMLYELGGHDGYRAPIEAGESMGDYAIRFPGVDAVTPYGMDAQNMITPKTVTRPLQNGRMPLKPSAYDLDTIILDGLPERRAVLVDGNDRPRVSVAFDDFPYLGVWTAAKDFDTNYVCIEPWTSLPDATFVGREMKDKAGVRTLAPGAAEELTYRVTIHE